MAGRLAFFPWQTLTDRERMVWACGYVQHPDNAAFAAEHADALVSDLRRLSLDHSDALAPECEVARAGVSLTREDFLPWYRVAWRVRHGPHEQPEPSGRDIEAASERFEALRTELP